MTRSMPLRATLARLLTPAMLLALAGAGHCTGAVLPPAAALAQAPATAAPPESEGWVHAYAAYGTPRYGPAFTHFDFVNPQAPRGGTLFLANPDRRSNFDKFNPYTLKGNAPAGVSLLMIVSLAVVGADEPLAMYGLLAERIRVAADRSTVSFRLHAAARFSNGDPVLAEDVKYSFDSLSGPYAAPSTQTALSGVARATVLDDRTIRFDLKDRTVDTVFAIGGLPVFSRKWAPGPDGKPRRFDEIVNEIPIGSGPYTIDLTDSGRRIEFKRNPQYWAGDQPVRRGYYNFDRIVYRYYADEDVRTEAFKAGEFDLIRVYSARKWARQFGGPKWNDGRIVKVMFEKGTGQGLQSIQLNLRRPIFQDIRVRQALILTYDFERLVNKYRQYHRTSSIFSNSEFAAVGLPSRSNT
jgi:peptide/nickel transport system substrate-binding protein/microcin C transport system substrate-binding protein